MITALFRFIFLQEEAVANSSGGRGVCGGAGGSYRVSRILSG